MKILNSYYFYFIVLMLFSYTSLATAGKVIVSYPSYQKKVDRLEMIRHYQFREALIFHLKLGGFQVAHESVLPPREVDYVYTPVTKLQEIATTENANLIMIDFDGEFKVSLYKQSSDASYTKTITKDDQFTSIARDIVSELGVTLKSRLFKNRTRLSGTFMKDSAYADMPFVERLEQMSIRLDKLNEKPIDVNNLSELSLLYLIHGSYYLRTNELLCLEYLGRSRFMIQLANEVALSGDHPTLQRIRQEVDLLVQRFGAGWQFTLVDRPVLYYTQRLLSIENQETELNTLFDFFVGVEGFKLSFNKDIESEDFKQLAIDFYLIWSKFPNEQEAQWAKNGLSREVGLADYRREVKLYANYLDLGDAEQTQLLQVLEEGYEVKKDYNNGFPPKDIISAGLYTLIREMNGLIESESKYSSSFDLAIQDLNQELINRYIHVIDLRKDFSSWLGSQKVESEVASILDHYGRESIHLYRRLVAPSRFRVERIRNFNSLVNFMHDQYNDPYPNPSKKILQFVDPALQELLMEKRMLDNAEKQQIIDAFNKILLVDTLFDAENFEEYLWSNELTRKNIVDFLKEASAEEIAWFNNLLIESSYEDYISEKDPTAYRNIKDKILIRELNQAQRLYKNGDYSRAQAILVKYPALISYYYRVLISDGQVDQALTVASDILDTGFERVSLLEDVLTYKRTDFGSIPDKILRPEKSVRSDNDYVTQAEYRLREQEYDTINGIYEAYHYTLTGSLESIHLLAQILSAETPDEVENSIWNELNDAFPFYYNESYFFQSFSILNERLNNSEKWRELVQKNHLTERALSNKIQTYGLQKLPKEQCQIFWDELESALLNETLPEELRYELVIVQQLLLARWAISELDGQPSVLFVDKLEQAVTNSRELSLEPGREVPSSALFIGLMVSFAGNIDAISKYISSIPNITQYFKNAELMFNTIIRDENLLKIYLKDFQLNNSNWDLIPISWPPIDIEFLLSEALKGGDNACVRACAYTLLTKVDSFKGMAVFFPEEEKAIEWIDLNAPDPEKAKIWLESYRTTVLEGNLQFIEIAEVPDLFDFFGNQGGF